MNERKYENFMNKNRELLSYIISENHSSLRVSLEDWDVNKFHTNIGILIGASGLFLCLTPKSNVHWATIVSAVIIAITFLFFVFFFFNLIKDSVTEFIFNRYFIKQAINRFLDSEKEQEIDKLFKEYLNEADKLITNAADDKKEEILENLKEQYRIEMADIKSFYWICSEKIEHEYKTGQLSQR